jgi:hypothetical protein
MYRFYKNLCINRNTHSVINHFLQKNVQTHSFENVNECISKFCNKSQDKLILIPQHNIIDLGSIDHISNIVKNLAVNQKKRILLVCDIDDTLIRPSVNLGTDPWFYHSLKDDHIINVKKKLNLLYALLDFNGVEKATDDFVKLIENLSDSDKYDNPLMYMCLTARCVSFHSYTSTHLNDSGYGRAFVRPNMLLMNDPLYIRSISKIYLCSI